VLKDNVALTMSVTGDTGAEMGTDETGASGGRRSQRTSDRSVECARGIPAKRFGQCVLSSSPIRRRLMIISDSKVSPSIVKQATKRTVCVPLADVLVTPKGVAT